MDDTKKNPALEDMHRRIRDQMAIDRKRSFRFFALVVFLVFAGTVFLIKSERVCSQDVIKSSTTSQPSSDSSSMTLNRLPLPVRGRPPPSISDFIIRLG